MRKTILTAVAATAALVLAASGFVAAWLRVPQTMTVRRVGVQDAVHAMAGDHFYSDYRLSTLLVTATVARDEPALRRITFAGTGRNVAMCQLSNTGGLPAPGTTVTVATVAARAVRVPDGVLFTDCVTTSPA